jgi:hypothetical protein
MYTIDRSISWNNTIVFSSDNGTKYGVQLLETAPGSKLWTFNFKLIEGVPDQKEVFKTMSVLQDVLLEPGGLIERNNVNEIVVFIDGKSREEIDQKTKIFTRWIKSPWIFNIESNPEIIITGKRDQIYPNTNFIHIKKTDVIEQVTPIETNKTSINLSNIKFCYNCGSENNNYKFCPSCGTNLQQA